MMNKTFEQENDASPLQAKGGRGNAFKEESITGFRTTSVDYTGKIYVCEVCYNNTFVILEGGQRKCKKCGQIYWV